MPDVLTPIQACLGFTRADWTARNQLRILVDDHPYVHTFPLPTEGSPYFNDRYGTTTNPMYLLYQALDAALADASRPGSWGLTADLKGIGNVVLGYYTYQVSGYSDPFRIQWTHASSTVDPLHFGFSGESDTVLGEDAQIVTEYQAGRLWLPGDTRRFPSRWDSRKVKRRKGRLNPNTGQIDRYGTGGYTLWRLRYEALEAVYLLGDRAAYSTYRKWRPGMAEGDPNVSWETGIWQYLTETTAQLRIWPGRDNPSNYVDVAPYREEELGDLMDTLQEKTASPERFGFEWTFPAFVP